MQKKNIINLKNIRMFFRNLASKNKCWQAPTKHKNIHIPFWSKPRLITSWCPNSLPIVLPCRGNPHPVEESSHCCGGCGLLFHSQLTCGLKKLSEVAGDGGGSAAAAEVWRRQWRVAAACGNGGGCGGSDGSLAAVAIAAWGRGGNVVALVVAWRRRRRRKRCGASSARWWRR